MFMTNVYSCMYTFFSLVHQEKFYETINFIQSHNDIAHNILLLSFASAIGQVFIFVTIQKFGALVFTLIMTTRQLIAIILSSIIFKNTLSYNSIFGIALIFFALFSKNLYNLYLTKFKAKTIITK